jgi:heme-degrading monooxygenase HmoA
MWEFQVKQGCEADFEKVYGPQGEWAQFFKQGAGYRGTELLRDPANPRRYVTIDRWASQAAYEAFQSRSSAEYEAIDRHCEELTESEALLGSFSLIGPGTD